MTFTSEIMALTSQKKEFVFHNYFNSSNHNPEIIWRVRRKLTVCMLEPHSQPCYSPWKPYTPTDVQSFSKKRLLWFGFLLSSSYIFKIKLSVSKWMTACHIYHFHPLSLFFSILLIYKSTKHPLNCHYLYKITKSNLLKHWNIQQSQRQDSHLESCLQRL